MTRFVLRAAAVTPLLAVFAAAPAIAQENTFVWENGTEFAFVTTSGNASSTTLGLNSTLDGKSEVSAMKFEIGGIRASSNFITRTAVGTPDDFVVSEETRTEQSAANYFARGRFDRNLGENDFFVFGGAGWERNTFAGFNNRFSFVAGVGDAWIDDDVTLFKTDLGGTYTVQKDVEPTPGMQEGFGGLRATIEFKRALASTTDFETSLIADENLANTDDLRIDWGASISVALTEGLAFKTSYQMLYDADPALVGVPLLNGASQPSGVDVLTPSEGIDSFLTLSLVIKL
jgi:putative salt-induced outer membrane protein YdiY